MSPRLAGLLVALAAATACAEEPAGAPPAPARPPERRPAPPAPDLSALGYVDFAAVPGDDGRGGATLLDAARSAPGYTLYVSIPFARAALVDAAGAELASWSDPDARHWLRCELLPDGDLLVLGTHAPAGGGPPSAHVARLAFDGAERWRVELPAHHDVEWTSRGEVLVLSQARREVDPALGWPAVHDNVVVRLAGDGRTIDSRSLGDVLGMDRRLPDLSAVAELEGLPAADRDAFASALAEVEAWRAAEELAGAKRAAVEPDAGAWRPVDLLHANAVAWIERPDLAARGPGWAEGSALVTLRHQDEVALFRWDTGELLWRFGRGVLQGPHEASLTAAGNVLVLDNGIRGRGHSRVVEIDPETDAIVWSWSAPEPERFYCATRGTCQELANGNVLVCDSERGEAFEVARSGEVVWRFVAPERDEAGRRGAIRARRYPPSAVEPFLGEAPGIRRSSAGG